MEFSKIKVVSSVKKHVENWSEIRYKIGPSTLPWGTPAFIGLKSDKTLFTLTAWNLSLRYDLKSSRGIPLIP